MGLKIQQQNALWDECMVLRDESLLPLCTQLRGAVTFLLLLARILGRVAAQTRRRLHRV